MIYFITEDRRAKSQLALLLRELGENNQHFPNADALLDTVICNSTDIILLDLNNGSNVDQLQALQSSKTDATIIGLETFDSMASSSTPTKPDGLEHFVLLPSHGERAKSRLKAVLRSHNSEKAGTYASLPGFSRPAFLKSQLTKSSFTSQTFSRRKAATSAPIKLTARFIAAESKVGQNFLTQLNRDRQYRNLRVITGNEGAEFDLVSDEINYIHHQDRQQLLYLPWHDITLEKLELLEKEARKDAEVRFCYLGRTDDLNEDCAQTLVLFCEYLVSLRNPHLQLLISHEKGSQIHFKNGVSAIIAPLLKNAFKYTIPDINERPEDIPSICISLVSTLRTAHPFVSIRSISREAIDYLIEKRAEISHAKLVRILRNAVALSQRTEITIHEIKNYGEHDLLTSHLVESMADESFFKNKEAINS